MIRHVNISVDHASWPSPGAPSEFLNLEGNRATDVLSALIHTAIWTRPPEVHGFHLSDSWACFRYAPAFADVENLRLREEWGQIDPHQKTILSDELGVGFTTELLASELGCQSFIDTGYFVQVAAPGMFELGAGARLGPRKAPDYIAIDSQNRYGVLECKGTQTSHAVLLRSMERGIAQKENLSTSGTTAIRFSIVAGLYVPQWEGREDARIHITDPDWSTVREILSRTVSVEVGLAACIQLTLAKFFALAGFRHLANFLAKSKIEGSRRLPPEALHDLESFARQQTGDGFGEASIDLAQGRGTMSTGLQRLRRFTVQMPLGLAEGLMRADDLTAEFLALRETLRDQEWSTRSAKHFTILESPLGFRFRLDVGI